MGIVSFSEPQVKQPAGHDWPALLFELRRVQAEITNADTRCQLLTDLVCHRAPVPDFIHVEFDRLMKENRRSASMAVQAACYGRFVRAQGIGQKAARPDAPRSAGQVWIDPEAYRWSYALGRGPQYMLWALAFSLSHNGRVDIDTLAAAAGYSSSYFYELLAVHDLQAGNHPFFRGKDQRWLYLRSQRAIGEHLARDLLAAKLYKVLDGRRPGVRRVQVAFRADQPTLRAAWLASKRRKRFSRQCEAQLWNVDKNTLRRWDRAAGIHIEKNFSQSADLRDERVPADREDYQLVKQQDQLLATWQLSNTYHVRQTFPEHPHKGQARKVRKATSAVLRTEQPAEHLAAAHPFRLHNFAGGGNPLQAWKDYSQAVRRNPFAQVTDFLFVGHRAGHGIWELMAYRPGQEYPRTTSGQFVRVNG